MKHESMEDYARRRRRDRVHDARMSEVNAQKLGRCREAVPCWKSYVDGVDDNSNIVACACLKRRSRLNVWAKLVRADLEYPDGPPQKIHSAPDRGAWGTLIYHQAFEVRCWGCDQVGHSWVVKGSVIGPTRRDVCEPEGWFLRAIFVDDTNERRVMHLFGPGYGPGSSVSVPWCPACEERRRNEPKGWGEELPRETINFIDRLDPGTKEHVIGSYTGLRDRLGARLIRISTTESTSRRDRDRAELSLWFENGAELELEWTGGFWTGEMTASGQGDKDTGHGLDAFWIWMHRAGRLVSFEPRRLSSMPFTARHGFRR